MRTIHLSLKHLYYFHNKGVTMETTGEKVIRSLLNRLPKEEYFYVEHPTIVNDSKSAYQEPDFVIVSVSKGVIVLEVKDWINIRIIEQKQIEILTSDNRPLRFRNPLLVAKEYAHNLERRFEQKRELRHQQGYYAGKLMFPWHAAVVLSNTDSETIRHAEQRGVWQAGHVLGKDDLTPERFEQALKNIPSAWKLQQPLARETLDVIRSVIDPRSVISNAKGEDTGHTFTIEQEAIVHAPLPTISEAEAKRLAESANVRLIRGVAGSGKSLVLAMRAQYLAATQKDFHVLVLTFSKELMVDLKQRIPGHANLEIVNFEEICRRIITNNNQRTWRDPVSIEQTLLECAADLLHKSGLSVDFVADEINYRQDMNLYTREAYLNFKRLGRALPLNQQKREQINAIFDRYLRYLHENDYIDMHGLPRWALKELQPGHILYRSYDAILIDEAQDFAPSWINVVKRLLKPKGHLFICEDPTQSIFRYFSWREKGINVVGRTHELKISWRCTREITMAAHSLIRADPILSQRQDILPPDLDSYQLTSGEVPRLLAYPSRDQERRAVDLMLRSLINGGMSANDIAILCHNRQLVNDWTHWRNQGCHVMAFADMKGLEFVTVFIPHLNTLCDPAQPPFEEVYVSNTRRLVFTAMTRARQTLILSQYGALPDILEPMRPYVKPLVGNNRQLDSYATATNLLNGSNL